MQVYHLIRNEPSRIYFMSKQLNIGESMNGITLVSKIRELLFEYLVIIFKSTI